LTEAALGALLRDAPALGDAEAPRFGARDLRTAPWPRDNAIASRLPRKLFRPFVVDSPMEISVII